MYDFNTKSWGYIWLDFITKTRTWTQTDKMPVGYCIYTYIHDD
jgi:hypothetical protein